MAAPRPVPILPADAAGRSPGAAGVPPRLHPGADAGAGRGAAGTTLGAGEKKPLCGGGQWPGMPGDGGAIGPGVDRVVAALSRVCMAIGELCEEVQSRAANGRTVLYAAGRSR